MTHNFDLESFNLALQNKNSAFDNALDAANKSGMGGMIKFVEQMLENTINSPAPVRRTVVRKKKMRRGVGSY